MKEFGIDIEAFDKNKNKYKIEKIKDAKYVYAYGIKQLLSHIIGILNFREIGALNYDDSTLPQKANVRFLTLINSMPGYTYGDVAQKTIDFISHYNKTIAFLRKNGIEQSNKIEKLYDCKTFQCFYEEIKRNYKLLNNVIEYYHFEEE